MFIFCWEECCCIFRMSNTVRRELKWVGSNFWDIQKNKRAPAGQNQPFHSLQSLTLCQTCSARQEKQRATKPLKTSSTPTKFWELHPALVPPQGGCSGRAGMEQVLPRLLGSPSALLEALVVGRVHHHQRGGWLVSTHEASKQPTPPWWSLKRQLTSLPFWFWQRKLGPGLIWFCLLQANQAYSLQIFHSQMPQSPRWTCGHENSKATLFAEVAPNVRCPLHDDDHGSSSRILQWSLLGGAPLTVGQLQLGEVTSTNWPPR